MALAAIDPQAPEFVHRYVNLADARLGATALAASDDFFAECSRMLQPAPAQFIPGKYDANGKWMDGWESRRKRGPGHDWCIVRLARPGLLHGVDIDTSHFTGNYPPAASLEACHLAAGDPDERTPWHPLLPVVALGGNSHHYHALQDPRPVSHLRLNIFPDGGVARLRAYGTPAFTATPDADGLVDLASALNGATIVAANNEHFGRAATLLLPGRGVDMGDGWETRRRREPGNDWCIVALARPGVIEAVEVDTAHFKGNYPDRCALHGAYVNGGSVESIVAQAMFWPPLLPPQPLQMDHQHHFRAELLAHPPVTHVRFDIHPDGGVSRLRLRGRPA